MSKQISKRALSSALSILLRISPIATPVISAWGPRGSDEMRELCVAARQVSIDTLSARITAMARASKLFNTYTTYSCLPTREDKDFIKEFYCDMGKGKYCSDTLESLAGSDDADVDAGPDTDFLRAVWPRLSSTVWGSRCYDGYANRIDFSGGPYDDKDWAAAYDASHDVVAAICSSRLSEVSAMLDAFLLRDGKTNLVRVLSSPATLWGMRVFSIGMVITRCAMALADLRAGGGEINVVLRNLIYGATATGVDVKNYKKILKNVESRLREKLVGQDRAIDRIIAIMGGYYQSLLESKIMGTKFEGGAFLYLTGKPGRGKSEAMRIIQEEMGLSSYIGRMSDIMVDPGNGAKTVAERFTKPTETFAGLRKRRLTIQTPFMRQVLLGKPTLYCFDECDKMRIYDAQLQGHDLKDSSGCIRGGTLDELLRNFIDNGLIASKNASGSMVVVTSNECADDIASLEPSLRDRYRPYIVAFDDFTTEDFKELIRRATDASKSKYIETQEGARLAWSEHGLDYYATKFVEANESARVTEPLMRKLGYELTKFLDSLPDTDRKISEKIIEIDVEPGDTADAEKFVFKIK